MFNKFVWNLKMAAVYFWVADYSNAAIQLGLKFPVDGATIR